MLPPHFSPHSSTHRVVDPRTGGNVPAKIGRKGSCAGLQVSLNQVVGLQVVRFVGFDGSRTGSRQLVVDAC